MDDIFNIISQRTGITEKAVRKTIDMLNDGATIPFISRYRKEATGGLNELQIQSISDEYKTLDELAKRREFIYEAIVNAGKMTEELSGRIANCWNAQELEDIYLPFKPKRRTRAEVARSLGLEPLAKIIMSQHACDIESKAERFLNDDVENVEQAINGASDIIAEWISENEKIRNIVRSSFRATAQISSRVIKGKEIEGEKYRNYFDCHDSLRNISSHRLLAMRRGEKEGFLKISITNDDETALRNIRHVTIKSNCEASDIVEKASCDSYKRLIRPSIETEFATESKEKADDKAIELFATNLRQLLFAPPLGHKRVLAIDPGFRTGCKVVCLDEQGNLLHDCVIYPTPPRSDFDGAKKTLFALIQKYKINAISLGNGTASRETEQFLSSIGLPENVKIYVVNESGASIYSASQVARDEFPDKDVTVRGAVSIGRRLLDPLAELVKIDPKSIGVGQYQHDVDQNKLKHALNFTVESCVNNVGVNVNTASPQLLSYISGLGPVLARNIVKYRAENGDFLSRSDLLKVPRMGEKAFKMAAGFLRVPLSDNPLDNTSVHPERYALVKQIARDNGCSVIELIQNKQQRDKIDLKRYISDEVGMPTLTDIMAELEKPGRDPRTDSTKMIFDNTVNSIEDLYEGMELSGIVSNITQFGIFVDIGVHTSGLVHISEISDKFISSPSDVVKLGEIVKVRIINVDKGRNRISLSMKNIKQ